LFSFSAKIAKPLLICEVTRPKEPVAPFAVLPKRLTVPRAKPFVPSITPFYYNAVAGSKKKSLIPVAISYPNKFKFPSVFEDKTIPGKFEINDLR